MSQGITFFNMKDNVQDLQSDVFGGGMTGKFWDMYKGSKTYDSLDDSDTGILVTSSFIFEIFSRLKTNLDPQIQDTETLLRQMPEKDQPEDYPNPLRGQREGGKEENVVLAIKVSFY